MKKLHIFIASLLAMSSVWTTAQTVHTIGDSTMADYNESTTDQRGWGQMFQQFFDETITVNNRGKSGASSKSFYEESAYWPSVKNRLPKAIMSSYSLRITMRKTAEWTVIQYGQKPVI